MRKAIATTVFLVGVLACAAPAGCFFDLADDCKFNMNLACFYDNQGGGGGGTGGSPPGCTPSETNKDIAEVCGAFVSPTGSDANGDGTKGNPYLTIGKAAGEKARVYACANPDKPFDEAVAPGVDVVVYGGFDCADVDWPYDPTKKSAWTAPADSVPLTVSGDVKVEVYDFTITARDAGMAGGSSLAVLAAGDKTEIVLERCDVVAGAGKDGEPGTTPDTIGPNHEGEAGEAGGNGDDGDGDNGTATNSCKTIVAVVVGGAGGQHLCGPEMLDVAGGLGGTGSNAASGANGGDGSPAPAGMDMPGSGGAWDGVNGVCKPGVAGANGTAGQSGSPATGYGALTATGYAGAAGENGKEPGKHGQGGGGGGGGKTCGGNMAGPGGGGGGAGGCGGLPGTGGKGGGSSIGIAAMGAKSVLLLQVNVTVGAGGTGGKGGNGQPGGAGGNNGFAGGAEACAGAPGGKGGRGGSAGGGQGGHSLGIAYTGAAPSETQVTVTAGTLGEGGPGGDDNDALKGADGQACSTFNFDDGTCTK